MDQHVREAHFDLLDDYRVQHAERRALMSWTKNAVTKGRAELRVTTDPKRRAVALGSLKLLIETAAYHEEQVVRFEELIFDLERRLARDQGGAGHE